MWSFVCDTRIIPTIAVISTSRCVVVPPTHIEPCPQLRYFRLSVLYVCSYFKKISREGNLNLCERILTCDVWLNCYTWLRSTESLSKMFLEIWVYLPISRSVHMSLHMMEHCFFQLVLKFSQHFQSVALYCSFIQHAIRTPIGLDLKLSRLFSLGAVQNLRSCYFNPAKAVGSL